MGGDRICGVRCGRCVMSGIVDAPTVSNAGVPVSRAKETVPGIRNGLMVWTGLDWIGLTD